MTPKWTLITLKQYPVFSRQWILEAFRDEQEEILGYGFRSYKSLETGIYASEAEVDELKDRLVKVLEDNPSQIRKLTSDWIHDCDDLVSYTKKVGESNLTKRCFKELTETLKESVNRFKRTAGYIFLAHVLGDHIEEKITQIIDSKIDEPKKRSRILQSITTCRRKTSLYDAHQRMLGIAEKADGMSLNQVKADSGMMVELEHYTKSFRWLGYDTGLGRDLTLEDTLAKLEGVLNTGKEESLEGETGKNLDPIHSSREDKILFDVMDDLIYGRAQRRECI